VWHSDGSWRYDGWEARIECVPPCEGTPDAGVASISMEEGCNGINTTLYVYGNHYDVNGVDFTGYTYQWQESALE